MTRADDAGPVLAVDYTEKKGQEQDDHDEDDGRGDVCGAQRFPSQEQVRWLLTAYPFSSSARCQRQPRWASSVSSPLPSVSYRRLRTPSDNNGLHSIPVRPVSFSFVVVVLIWTLLSGPVYNLPLVCAFSVVVVPPQFFCIPSCGWSSSSDSPSFFATSTKSAANAGTGIRNARTRRFLYAPPGSGYASRDDETSVLPDTYEPMMEYPGTMRPGKTPENMPFHDLPLDDNGPRDPVPWPHFQQISWHHPWEPPHDHPVPIEDFIEMQGRWSTPELEARMRMGARRAVRDSRESQEEAGRRPQTVITDDDDDDDNDTVEQRNVALGEGVFGRLGSDVDRAATAIATAAPSPRGDDGQEQQDAEDDDDAGLDFLLDLGLDMLDLGDDESGGGVAADLKDDAGEGGRKKRGAVAGASRRALAEQEDDEDIDVEFDDEDVTPASTINVDVDEDDEDDVIDFGVDDDEDGVGGVVGMDLEDDEDDDDLDVDDDDEDVAGAGASSGLDEVSLDVYGDGDGLDNEIFDEGGFDYDDYDNDNDGGDMW